MGLEQQHVRLKAGLQTAGLRSEALLDLALAPPILSAVMERACLVTGKSGPLLAEIVRQAAARQRQILLTRSGRMDSGAHEDDAISTIAWNRRSALSSRSVLLHATNLFGRLDEAVVVFAPAHDTATFHESSIVGIEDRIDAEVKGYLYILREILAVFMKQGGGRVVLVLQEPPGELQSPLEAAGVGSFTALADALARYYQNEPVAFHRLRTDGDDAAGFAAMILDLLDAQSRHSSGSGRSGRRWLRFPSRIRVWRRGTALR